MKFSLAEIKKITNGEVVNGSLDGGIKSIHCSTYYVKKNSLFIVPKKEKNVSKLLLQAEKLGAVAAIIPKEYNLDIKTNLVLISVVNTLNAFHLIANAYRRKFSIPLIAVTGSNGKTTTKDTVAHVLGLKNKTFKTPGNLNNIYGVPLTLLALRSKYSIGVVEMGIDYYGQVDLMAKSVEPEIGIITNIHESHLANFGTRENIARAKGELLNHIPKSGYALLNGDDPLLRNLAKSFKGKVFFFGTKEDDLDIKADNIKQTNKGIVFNVEFKGSTIQDIFVPLHGEFNVYNILPAIFIAHQYGYTSDEIKKILKTLTITDKRFQTKKGRNGVTIVDDAYNASPTSMKHSIKTFSELYRDKKKILVLGDMLQLGNASTNAHVGIGKYLNQFEDKDAFHQVITYGQKASLISKNYNGKKVHTDSVSEVVKVLKSYLAEDYVILFKASGKMRLEKIMNQIV